MDRFLDLPFPPFDKYIEGLWEVGLYRAVLNYWACNIANEMIPVSYRFSPQLFH